MIGYVARRLILAMLILVGVASVVFVIMRLIPADPALLILGAHATPEQTAALRTEMGLDQPLFVQYFKFLSDLVRFDFGESYRLRQPVTSLILQRLPASLELAAVSMLLAVVIGIPMGVIAALRANTITDRVVSFLSLVTQSLPGFWVGIILILIFARELRWLPSGGVGTPAHIVLPAITLGLPFVAILARMTRSSVLEVINENYIQTARAKGLPERTVVFPHAIRNALIPIVTLVGLQFGQLFGGAVIIEVVFAWPGIGRMLIEAIGQRDYEVVQGVIVVIAGGFILINLIVDIFYGYLNPRVRLVK